jgi:hypothetical protein
VPERETRLVVIVPQAAGLGSDAVRYDQTAKQQSDVSRDLQSALLLCCSVALLLCGYRTGYGTTRVS